MSSRRSRVGGLAAAALAVGMLAGCGSYGVAATVNGTTITENEVRTAAAEITKQNGGQTPYSEQQALVMLILAPTVLAEARTAHVAATEAQARSQLTRVPDPARATLTIVQAGDAYNALPASSKTRLGAAFSRLDVSMNPRYGTFDTAKGFAAEAPPWIAAG